MSDNSLTNIFTPKQKKVNKTVAQILSGLTGLVADLNEAIALNQAKVDDANVKIENLNKEIDSSNAEIITARNAAANISTLLGRS